MDNQNHLLQSFIDANVCPRWICQQKSYIYKISCWTFTIWYFQCNNSSLKWERSASFKTWVGSGTKFFTIYKSFFLCIIVFDIVLRRKNKLNYPSFFDISVSGLIFFGNVPIEFPNRFKICYVHQDKTLCALSLSLSFPLLHIQPAPDNCNVSPCNTITLLSKRN